LFQQLLAVVESPIEGLDDNDVVVVGHGMVPGVAEETAGRGTDAAELIPRLPSSVAPSGMLVRPACKGDGVEVGVLSLPVPAHAAGAAAVMPPPSNSAVDVWVVEPVVPAHTVFPGMRPEVDGDTAGLRPGAAISVAPNPIPVGWTVEPSCRPSGVVAPMPGDKLVVPLVCADTGLQTMSAAIMTRIGVRLIVRSISKPLRRGGNFGQASQGHSQDHFEKDLAGMRHHPN